MAVSLIASYFVNSSGQIATAISTPSFTPSNGEVIVVKLATWTTTTAMGAPTGGSQAYTPRVINAPGGFNEWCGIYTAVISGSPGSMTISSTPGASARFSMTVERWSGAQLAATPVTNSNTATTGAAQSTITPSAGTSVISWVAGDAQSVDPSTRTLAGSGTDEGVRDDHVGANGVDYYGYQSASGTSSQTYGLTAPTGLKWVIAGIEIQATTGANPALSLTRPARRRIPLVVRAARRGRIATPVRAQINPPFPFTQVKQWRGLRAMLPRRPHAAAPVPAQVVVVAPKFPFTGLRTRLRGALPRRPRVVTPVPDQGFYPPATVRTRLRGLLARRPRAVGPVPAQVVVPPAYPIQSVRARVRGLRLFRGKSSGPIPDQGTVPAGRARPVDRRGGKARPHASAPPVDQGSVPGQSTGRRRFGFRRPGRIVQPTPIQAAPALPAYPPALMRTRLRGLRIFRGRSSSPVPGQIVVTAPGIVIQAVRTRIRGLKQSRPTAVAPVPGQIIVTPPGYPPQSVRTRLRGLKLFRGRSSTPVPGQIVIAPPGIALQSVRARVKALWPRRARAAAPPLEQAAPPPAPHAHPHPLAPRRAHIAMPPPPQTAPPPAYPVPPVRPRLKALLRPRGRSAALVPAQVVVVPPPYAPTMTRVKQRFARLMRGVARFTPLAPLVVAPRTPTLTVDLARALGVADLSRPVAVADLSRSAAIADLTRTAATADLTRPSVLVAL